MTKLKQKGSKELVESFLATQHKKSRRVGQPSLALQANSINLKKTMGRCDELSAPTYFVLAHVWVRSLHCAEACDFRLREYMLFFVCVLSIKNLSLKLALVCDYYPF